MEWFILLLAGISEVIWAVSMKVAEGFSKLLPTIITIIFYLLSALFLSLALKKLPLSTAYALWTGFGIVATTLIGIIYFNETINLIQVICIMMIVLGIIGLKALG